MVHFILEGELTTRIANSKRCLTRKWLRRQAYIRCPYIKVSPINTQFHNETTPQFLQNSDISNPETGNDQRPTSTDRYRTMPPRKEEKQQAEGSSAAREKQSTQAGQSMDDIMALLKDIVILPTADSLKTSKLTPAAEQALKHSLADIQTRTHDSLKVELDAQWCVWYGQSLHDENHVCSDYRA